MGITVRNLSKRYGDVQVLEDISFELGTSKFLVVLGPSGSGKTTLLRIIAGLEYPDRGEILINKRKVSFPGYVFPPHKRNLGFVFQSSALWPHMTVEQNILFGLKNTTKKKAVRRVEELLELLSITHIRVRYPSEISGGEARRAALARSLAPNPLCLLMDEPLTNLDADMKENLLEFIISTLKESNTSLIYVTHDLEEGNKISNYKLTLKNGLLLET